VLDYGFATLADLKLRLGVTDTTDDALLAAILDQTAGTIEGVAGRILRRDHARVEVCNGNSDLLRVNVSPIAKVHSVRESETGGFVTAANYAELVEGTDFFIEGGQGGDSGRPGEPALIRRLGNKKWMGAWAGVAARTRVVYTGGFKTDEELSLENQSVVISAPTDILDYRVVYSGVADDLYFVQNVLDTEITFNNNSGYDRRVVIRFAVGKSAIVLPCWTINKIYIQFSAKVDRLFAAKFYVFAIDIDPLLQGSPALVYGAVPSISNGGPNCRIIDIGWVPATVNTYEAYDFETTSGMSIFYKSLLNKFLAFMLIEDKAGCVWTYSAVEAASLRPKLTVTHGMAFTDEFGIPDDLRNANIIQAIHEYQTRKTPGMISQAMRGVSIASGASYMKTLAALLPEVEAVAMHYRRLY